MTPRYTTLSVHISATSQQADTRRKLREAASELCAELRDFGEVSIAEAPPESVPDGAKGVFFDAVDLIATLISSGAGALQITEFIKRWRSRNPDRMAIGVTVTAVPEGNESAPSPPSPVRPGRYCLIVANSSYDDPALRQLRSPASDATALAAVLGDPQVGQFDVELAIDLDERSMRRRIAGFFAGRQVDDLLLIHVSCHGVKDQSGQLYLAARDTEIEELGATGVSADFVARQMAGTQARRVVTVLDCCYSGAFGSVPAAMLDERVNVGVLVAGRPAGAETIILSASTATEYAFEGDRLAGGDAKPSVFTAALVEGLRDGRADLDNDGKVSIDELYAFAYRRVTAGTTTAQQNPQIWTFGVTGQIVIGVRPARQVVTEPRPVAPKPAVVVTPAPSPAQTVRAVPPRQVEAQDRNIGPQNQVLPGFRAGMRRAKSQVSLGDFQLNSILRLIDDAYMYYRQARNGSAFTSTQQAEIDGWRRRLARLENPTGVTMVSVGQPEVGELLAALATLTTRFEALTGIRIPLDEFALVD